MLQIQEHHIHKRKPTKAQNIYSTTHNNSGRFQHPTLINGQIMEGEMKRDAVKLAEVMKQLELINIYRTFHSKTKEYTLFSAPHDAFSKTDHIVGHKAINIRRLKCSHASYQIAMD